ncbi:MAG: hypothetical protein A2176_14195 [Spirochaetes bacterium RBG_13_51_14]|nr:MAG: hypothetical protein A2176_14195 [Spirochaetes bacterium RBG_13_51_14]
MNQKLKKILIVSITANLIFVIVAAVLLSRAYYKKIVKPNQRDYYQDKVSLFRIERRTGGGIVFIGDSLTDRCEWSELLNRCDVVNRGIDGDTTDGVLDRISDVTKLKPAQLFIMVGGNDIVHGRKEREIADNYRKILARIRAESPLTRIYVQSILPTVYQIVPLLRNSIQELNGRLKTFADNRQVIYVDIYTHMADKNGDLKSAYTSDGTHLNGRGYLVWRDVLRRYIK